MLAWFSVKKSGCMYLMYTVPCCLLTECLDEAKGLETDEELRTGTVPYRVCMQIILYLQKVLLNFFFVWCFPAGAEQ